MIRLSKILGIAIGLSSLAGCRDVHSSQAKGVTAPKPTTYAGDVATILFEQCAS
jgi:hypothetical protein